MPAKAVKCVRQLARSGRFRKAAREDLRSLG